MGTAMKFLIDTVQKIEESYYITGVCYRNSNKENFIKVGDCFLNVYKRILKLPPEGNFEEVGKKDIREVKLQVTEIQAYGHSLDELYSGMSGGLYLVGEGGANLRVKDVLELN